MHMDGASFHSSGDTRAFLYKKGISVLLSAPYGFNSMAPELLFAKLKQGIGGAKNNSQK